MELEKDVFEPFVKGGFETYLNRMRQVSTEL
jgi:hypothetical protein